MHIRFDIPAYDAAMASFASSVMEGLATQNPIVGDIPVRRTVHPGPTRNVSGSKPIDHPLTRFEHTVVMHMDVIRHSQLEKFISILVDVSRQHQDALERELFRTLQDVCEGTGNVIDASGQPPNFDRIIDLIQGMEIRFDEDGMTGKPTIMMHPDTAQRLGEHPPSAEQMDRLNEILRLKKAEYDAQKRTRRLSG